MDEAAQPGLGLDPIQFQLEVEVAEHHEVRETRLEFFQPRVFEFLVVLPEVVVRVSRQFFVELDILRVKYVLHHIAFDKFGLDAFSFGVSHFVDFERQYFAVEASIVETHGVGVALNEDDVFVIDGAFLSVSFQYAFVCEEVAQIFDGEVAVGFVGGEV